jgi:hypothetical protein
MRIRPSYVESMLSIEHVVLKFVQVHLYIATCVARDSFTLFFPNHALYLFRGGVVHPAIMLHLSILNTTAWVYIAITIAWTLMLACGMGFLFHYRKIPGLRLRRPPLVFVSIISLHCYWTVCMLGYIIAPFAPCAAGFWMMSIYLPIGVAIFHLANSRFLDVASRQSQFTRHSLGIRNDKRLPEKKSWKNFFVKTGQGANINRMTITIAIPLAIQVRITSFSLVLSKIMCRIIRSI